MIELGITLPEVLKLIKEIFEALGRLLRSWDLRPRRPVALTGTF
jgi:hypothetical protein